MEVEVALRAVRTAQERLFGVYDPDFLDSSYGLQLVLANLGRRQESITLLRDTVAGRRSALGPEHPLTLRARASLLEALPAAEVATEEGGALLSLPAECDRLLGPDHTVAIGAAHNHAWALYLLGASRRPTRKFDGSPTRMCGASAPSTRSCWQPGNSSPGPGRRSATPIWGSG
ncbi:tetratricopeptide repeat protein [Streptomyces griseoviridis]